MNQEETETCEKTLEGSTSSMTKERERFSSGKNDEQG